MKKLFRIAIYFIVLNLLFGNSQIKKQKFLNSKKTPAFSSNYLVRTIVNGKKERMM